MDFHSRMLKDSYRKIFIVESLNTWQFENEYNASTDLVLTLDFGLKNLIQSHGGEAYFLDAIGKVEILQENNMIFLQFLQKWFLNEAGEDAFVYNNVKFGKSFRLVFWSELMSFVRICISLEVIMDVDYTSLILSESSNQIKMSLDALGIKFEEKVSVESNSSETYFFNIHRYMNEALANVSLKSRAILFYQFAYSRIRLWIDEALNSKNIRVCVQVYHPTLKIIQQLRKIRGVEVITSGYVPAGKVFSLLKQRLFLVPLRTNDYFFESESILAKFNQGKKNRMVLASGVDISKDCYELIDGYLRNKVPRALAEIDATLRFHKKLSIDINICISSIGIANIVNDEVSKVKGVKRLFIANGLLNSRFGDEGADFDFINCYSSSVKLNYFSNSTKALPLGDPRMDIYGAHTPLRVIDRENPVIVIGASGFSSTDFTSFAAIEFEFLFDVLNAIIQVPSYSKNVKIVIKVRANGFLTQYEKFVLEYFPFLNILIVQEIEIVDLLKKCDLYISIASQTLFEASCLGIPVIYYKNDREILDCPFDSQSELPTFHTSHELANALNDFRLSRDNLSVFQNREVMSKYIGPLDGQNLKRNIDFIKKLISTETV